MVLFHLLLILSSRHRKTWKLHSRSQALEYATSMQTACSFSVTMAYCCITLLYIQPYRCDLPDGIGGDGAGKLGRRAVKFGDARRCSRRGEGDGYKSILEPVQANF